MTEQQDLVQTLANIKYKAEENITTRCMFRDLTPFFVDIVNSALDLPREKLNARKLSKVIMDYQEILYHKATLIKLLPAPIPKLIESPKHIPWYKSIKSAILGSFSVWFTTNKQHNKGQR